MKIIGATNKSSLRKPQAQLFQNNHGKSIEKTHDVQTKHRKVIHIKALSEETGLKFRIFFIVLKWSVGYWLENSAFWFGTAGLLEKNK